MRMRLFLCFLALRAFMDAIWSDAGVRCATDCCLKHLYGNDWGALWFGEEYFVRTAHVSRYS